MQSPHPVITIIETFLQDYGEWCPTHYMLGDMRLQASPAFWRALILTYGDRYGQSAELAKSFPALDLDPRWKRELTRCIKQAHNSTKQLRERLALRMDTERVQMQRPLVGRSLLSITTCLEPRFTRAFRALTILGIHPEHGVEGYRVPDLTYRSLPFTLPTCLQDKLPSLSSLDRNRDVTVPAPKLNAFLQKIYVAATTPDVSSLDPFQSFVQRIIPTLTARQALGPLPDQFDVLRHGFVITVPLVVPSKQVILWSTWHATAGASEQDPTSKITAFVDLVPRRFFENSRDLEWYRYCNTHAPCDPGGGSSRGAYLSFVSMATDIARGLRLPDTYGLPASYLHMLDSGRREYAIDGDDYRGSGTLTPALLKQFHEVGYLVLDIPVTLATRLPPEPSLTAFSRFFRNTTGDLNLDLTHGSSLHRVLDMKTAEREVGSRFAYFSRGIPPSDPLNPFAHGNHSHNPQRGGKLIAMDCGMGKGSTFVSDSNHLAFQYSSFVYNVLSSFYRPGSIDPLVVVNERFRAKTTSVWKNGTHVDNATSKLIPIRFHMYQQLNHLPSFQ
jgi:hypothetical protein